MYRSGLHRLGFPQLKREDYNEVPNVTRWYDHIQFLVGDEVGEGKLERLVVDLDPIKLEKKPKKEDPPKKEDDKPAAEEGAKGKKKDDKSGAAAAPASSKKSSGGTADLFPLLDLRVGLVISVENHPSAEKLYVEKIDVGDGVRTIVSGLRDFVKAEDLKGARVLVICNLKPRKLQGIESDGMVLCCSNVDHTVVKLVTGAASVAPGTRVQCGDRNLDSKPEVLNPKKKIWETAQPLLLVRNGIAHYDGVPCTAHGEPLKSEASEGTIG
jgi:methionine--tRNA ligase beta chain